MFARFIVLFRSVPAYAITGLTVVAGLGLGGCDAPAVSTDSDTDVVDTDTGDPVDCEPLTLQADWDRVVPWGVLELKAQGGSGSVRFALQTSDSEASLHPTTGRLFAGGEPGMTYTATAVDGACEDLATLKIEVVPSLSVSPMRALVEPGTRFDLAVEGGVAEPVCELVVNGSGASLDGCTYVAGTSGVDRVTVSDPASGRAVSATYTVAVEAPLDLWGTRWMMPIDSTYTPDSLGGSGHLDIQIVEGDSVLVRDGTLVAVRPGETRLQVTDRFTGAVEAASARVAEPRVPSVETDGELGSTGRVVGTYDLNSDGYDDVVLGLAEANLVGQGSGGVFIYAGGPDGLEAEPAQVFGYQLGFQDEGGRAIAIADLNADGVLDLAWSAELASVGGASNGGVWVHWGLEDGFFETEPARVFSGTFNSDRLGSGLAACDFDGDGYADLAIGAYVAEDRTAERRVNDQGAIYIYRGSATGLAAEPSTTRFGFVPDGSDGWTARNVYLGRELQAGDLNGDGLCDLVSGVDFRSLTGSGNDGWMAVYLGDASTTVSKDPVRIISHLGTDTSASFARGYGLADVNGDGADELVVGAWRVAAPQPDSGAVFVYDGPSLADGTGDVTWDESNADLRFSGGGRSDFFGFSVSVYDQDDDGLADILIGAVRDEDDDPERDPDTGIVFRIMGHTLPDVWEGQQLTMAEVGEVVAIGEKREAFMGQAVGFAGDVDGDGLGDLFAFSGRDSTYGVELGTGFQVRGSMDEPEPVELPVIASGHGYGSSMALFDVTGDGQKDVVMGAPGFGLAAVGEKPLGANSGAVFAYAGARGDWANSAVPVETDWLTYSRSDALGHDLSTVDMDGDGYEDLVMVAWSDSKPSNYGSTAANPVACGGGRSIAGSVVVHRGTRYGIEPRPTWIAHGPYAGGRLFRAIGGLDFDGDGTEDILASGYQWGGGNRGGFGIIRGRPALEGGAHVLCFDRTWVGTEANALLGWSLADLGDIDGDGCDDAAIGARGEDLGLSNQGVVRVLWGGGSGCAKLPRITTMASRDQSAQAGWSVAGGGDVDGDGIPDLVVGAPLYVTGGTSVGAVWLVPGSYLMSLPAVDADNLLPTYQPSQVPDLLAPGPGRAIVGPAAGSAFGTAVALIPDPENPGRSLVAATMPGGDLGGGSYTGGAMVYRFSPDEGRFDPAPVAVVVGETSPFGTFGETLKIADRDGKSVLLIGAPDSNAAGPDIGAGYAFPMEAE
ncbi:MAG: FG-GAP-like repeat-containing protein [Myxococcota bacterium]